MLYFLLLSLFLFLDLSAHNKYYDICTPNAQLAQRMASGNFLACIGMQQKDQKQWRHSIGICQGLSVCFAKPGLFNNSPKKIGVVKPASDAKPQEVALEVKGDKLSIESSQDKCLSRPAETSKKNDSMLKKEKKDKNKKGFEFKKLRIALKKKSNSATETLKKFFSFKKEKTPQKSPYDFLNEESPVLISEKTKKGQWKHSYKQTLPGHGICENWFV